MSRPLIFVGSRQCISLLESIAILNDIEVVGIIDHHYYGNKEEINGIPIIGDERWLLQDNTQAKQWIRTCDFFPANYWDGQQYNNQGPNLQKLRQDRINLLDQSGVSVINLIHPTCLESAKAGGFTGVGRSMIRVPTINACVPLSAIPLISALLFSFLGCPMFT